MISAMSGCLNTKITKARIPKHDKLDGWEITCDEYIEKLENLLENQYPEIFIELEKPSDIKRDYIFSSKQESGYDFTLSVCIKKNGYVDQFGTLVFKEMSR